ncbi:MAG: MFS transporter [Acidobacteriota bacterium]|nr:MFS transporter [Acidobacteriota bacterium]
MLSEGTDGVRVRAGRATGVAFAALIALNLLNYVDRNLLPGALPVVKQASGLSDSRLGTLNSMFFVAYMVGGPALGWLGDRFSRRMLIGTAVCLWSVALWLFTVVHGGPGAFAAYMMVGGCEAAFGVYAVTLLSDYFPGRSGNTALGRFFLAMIAGRSAGHMLGGFLATTFGWRAPFRVLAGTGLLAGIAALGVLFDPRRDGAAGSARVEISRPQLAASLLRRPYVLAVLGLAMQTFASGGLAVWLPTYLSRYAGYSPGRATAVTGLATLVAGLSGTALGSMLGERLMERDSRDPYRLSAVSLLLGALCVAAILTPWPHVVIFGVFATQFVLFLNIGPLNLALLRAAPPEIRSTAVAAALVAIHLLGDAPSPQVIGMLSDAYDLRIGLLPVPLALLAGASLLACA